MIENTWSGKDTLIALLVVLIWGINFVPMRFGLDALSPLELGTARYLFATFPLIFFIPFPKVRARWVILSALLQGVLQFTLLFVGLQVGMTTALASILLQTQVFFTALWSFLLYRHRPTGLMWLSMGAASIGLIFFAVSALSNIQASGNNPITFLGLSMVLTAAGMWGAANLVSRQAQHESPHYNPLGFIVWMSAVALVVYLVLLLIFEPKAARFLTLAGWEALSFRTWWSSAFLGWASTLGGYALWTWLLKRHHANRVAPFSLGVPVVGITVGMIWLKEPIDKWQWIGSVWIGVALCLVVFGGRFLNRKRQKAGHS